MRLEAQKKTNDQNGALTTKHTYSFHVLLHSIIKIKISGCLEVRKTERSPSRKTNMAILGLLVGMQRSPSLPCQTWLCWLTLSQPGLLSSAGVSTGKGANGCTAAWCCRLCSQSKSYPEDKNTPSASLSSGIQKTDSTEDVRESFSLMFVKASQKGRKIAIFNSALPNRNRILNHKNNHSGNPTEGEVSWWLNGNFSRY